MAARAVTPLAPLPPGYRFVVADGDGHRAVAQSYRAALREAVRIARHDGERTRVLDRKNAMKPLAACELRPRSAKIVDCKGVKSRALLKGAGARRRKRRRK